MKRILVAVMLCLFSFVSVFAECAQECPPCPEHHHHRRVPPACMATKEQMDDVVAYVKKQVSDQTKMDIAKLSIKMCAFPVIGIGRIAKQFTFDSKRTEFLVYAYDYCPDKENYYLLRDVFTFKSEAVKMYEQLNLKYPTFDD